MGVQFERLIRFRSKSGQIYYGELGFEATATKESLPGQVVKVFEGGLPWDEGFRLTTQEEEISEVLCPISSTPIFECVGLNYRKHVEEAGFPKEDYPTIFNKPPDALAGPYEDIPIHKECQFMDYEAELCAIIGKDIKNITTDAEALSSVLGYTAGNDVSSRYWQAPERSGKQHAPAKSFDKFAPIGPTILNPDVVHKSKDGLAIRTFVNGELRQDARTDDLIFTVAHVIRHISRGKTIRKGTVIMTGTPGGVAAFMKPPAWLKNGDQVVVEIEKVGSISNTMLIED